MRQPRTSTIPQTDVTLRLYGTRGVETIIPQPNVGSSTSANRRECILSIRGGEEITIAVSVRDLSTQLVVDTRIETVHPSACTALVTVPPAAATINSKRAIPVINSNGKRDHSHLKDVFGDAAESSSRGPLKIPKLWTTQAVRGTSRVTISSNARRAARAGEQVWDLEQVEDDGWNVDDLFDDGPESEWEEYQGASISESESEEEDDDEEEEE